MPDLWRLEDFDTHLLTSFSRSNDDVGNDLEGLDSRHQGLSDAKKN
jgi:hypothetical protein